MSISLLSDLEVLTSVSEGMLQLQKDGPEARVAIDAEVEMWDPRLGEDQRGGMMWAAGGPMELSRKLSVMVRRPELTNRQRAVVSILQGRLRRMVA